MADLFHRTRDAKLGGNQQPDGRNISYNGFYIGFVKQVNDQLRRGSLKVWIPETGHKPNDETGWIDVQYCPPFAGATNLYNSGNSDSWTDSQTSYGFWFIPPDLENEVVCGFINGDPGRGIWFACQYNQLMNHMVPGIPGNNNTATAPVVEYNKLKSDIVDVDSVSRPRYSPLADQLVLQGLENDTTRGPSTSGARRSDPINQVSGILTPGGSQLVFDDADGNSFIRIRTRQGAQVLINDTIGSVYMNSRDGTNWIELSGDGFIDIYSENNINLRTQGDMNFRADGNMYFDAGGSVYMKARGEVRQFNQTIFLDATDAASNIVGQKTYTYQGNYQQGDSKLTTNTTIPPVIPDSPPPTSSDSSGNVQPTNSNVSSSGSNIKMMPNNTVAIGDDIAIGFASSYGCNTLSTSAGAGKIGIAQVNSDVSKQLPINNPYVVISVGTDDDYTVVNTAVPYQQLRSYINSGNKVVWILPANNRVAAAFIKQIAAQNGDSTVDLYKNSQIPLDSTEKEPSDYSKLVAAITSSPVLPGTQDPVSNANVTSSSSTTQAVPGAINGGLSLFNGQYIQFTKDITKSYNGPIYLVEGVGTAIRLVDTGTRDDGGEIKIEAAQDIHMTAHDNIFQTSLKEQHRIAGGDIFETSIGNYSRLSGGSVTDQAIGNFGIRAGSEIYLSGSKIHSNGPLAPNATQAQQAEVPLDNILTDVTYDSITQTYVERKTIVTRLPSHEPFIEHLQAGVPTTTTAFGRGAPHVTSYRKNLPPLAVITGPHLAWGNKVNSYDSGGATFRGKVWDMALKLGLPSADTLAPGYSGGDWLMAVMNFETGGSFSPKQPCSVGSAVGLIQFMPETAKHLDTTSSALRMMSPEEQLTYVYRYLSTYQGRYKSLTDLYCAVLWPKAIGQSENYILYSASASPGEYAPNHGLDTARKGYVNKADVTNIITKSLIDGLRVGNIWQSK